MRPIPVRGALCEAGRCRCPATRFARRLARRARRRFGRYPIPAPAFRRGDCAGREDVMVRPLSCPYYEASTVHLYKYGHGTQGSRGPLDNPYAPSPILLRLFAEAEAKSLAERTD